MKADNLVKTTWWPILLTLACGGGGGSEGARDVAQGAGTHDAAHPDSNTSSTSVNGVLPRNSAYGRCTNPRPAERGEEQCAEGYYHRVTSETCDGPQGGALHPCTSDADCDVSSHVCRCLGPNERLPTSSGYCHEFGECRTDADCTGGALCQSLYNTGLRYRCQKLEDECFTDADCVALHSQRLPRCDNWELRAPSRCAEPEPAVPPP